jgi:hypothetical protein
MTQDLNFKYDFDLVTARIGGFRLPNLDLPLSKQLSTRGQFESI